MGLKIKICYLTQTNLGLAGLDPIELKKNQQKQSNLSHRISRTCEHFKNLLYQVIYYLLYII